MNADLLAQVRQLSTEEQIELVETLWQDISECNVVALATVAQRAELDRRLAEHETNPNELVF